MRLLLLAFVLMGTLLVSSDAQAYPWFQFSSDTNVCATCHFSPAGGGMPTSWGREESADTLSRWGGDGEAFHGLFELPNWLNVGGDYRGAALYKEKGEASGGEFVVFPMQADLALRVTKGPISIAGTFGLRGRARDSSRPSTARPRREASLASFLVSREHYIAYKGEGSDLTIRAGRFYAPYGLRLPDHTSYIRRYLGFNMLRETYNLSASQVKSDTETHVSAHVSDPVLFGADPTFGLTAMHERRQDASAIGGNLRITRGPGDRKLVAGAHYKRWMSGKKLLLMAEIDGAYQRFRDGPSTDRFQLTAYAGPVWFPTEGVSASLAYELFDEDLIVKQVERHALSYWVSLWPKAHYEIFFLGRAQLIGSEDHVYTGMMQLHYYL